MLKIIIYIVLTSILILVLIDGIRMNHSLMKNYSTDERRIYKKYPQPKVKQYVDKSGNLKIRLPALILVIIFFVIVGLEIFIILISKKYYLLFTVLSISQFYNAWSLRVDHIFIKEYLNEDPDNILNLSILDQKTYKKGLHVFLRSGILIVILSLLFTVL